MQVPIEFRAVFLSIMCFFLWLPFIYNMASALLSAPRRKNRVVIGFTLLSVTSLIWGFFVPNPYPSWFGKTADHSKVDFVWWPQAISKLPHIPSEGIFFVGLFILGSLFIWAFLGGKRFYFMAWALILIQTFLHLSLHSPYTYLPHFEAPGTANYWYHSYLFPNNLGAVNEDYYWFWQSEALFHGSQGQLSVFWSRILPNFLSSRISTFSHPLYAWIIVSTFFWLVSVRAVYYIARNYFDSSVAIFAAFIQVSSPGMIAYVGQAKPYAFSFSLISILVAVFLHLMKERHRPIYSAVNFGACLGVTLLCYELQPWLLLFPLWARYLKIRWRELVLFSAIGVGIYLGFGGVSKIIPALTVKETFQPGYGSPLGNAVDLLTSFDWGRIWSTLHYSIKSWWVLTFHAFPTLLPFSIFGGFWIVRKQVKARSLLFLVLPGLVACLLIGVTNQSLYFQYGRMVFGNYVGMVILAAVTLSYLGNKVSPKLPYLLLGLNTLYWNLDVWGSPAIYFHWFYRSPSFANWF